MAHNIAVREQKLRLGFGISAENSFQRFERRGLVPALLIDPNFRRRDAHLRMRGDPFDDRACSTAVRTRVA
jgi:hypothetical protein